MQTQAWSRASFNAPFTHSPFAQLGARTLMQTVVWPTTRRLSTFGTLRLEVKDCTCWHRCLSQCFPHEIEARVAAASSEAAVSHPEKVPEFSKC